MDHIQGYLLGGAGIMGVEHANLRATPAHPDLFHCCSQHLHICTPGSRTKKNDLHVITLKALESLMPNFKWSMLVCFSFAGQSHINLNGVTANMSSQVLFSHMTSELNRHLKLNSFLLFVVKYTTVNKQTFTGERFTKPTSICRVNSE